MVAARTERCIAWCVQGGHCLFQSVCGRVVFIHNWYIYFGIMVMSRVNFSIIDADRFIFHLMTRAASGFFLVFWRNNRWSHVAHHCADKAYDGVPPCGRTMKTRPSADVGVWDACFCFGFSLCVTSNQKPDVWVLCCTIIIQSALLGELDRWICCVYAGVV